MLVLPHQVLILGMHPVLEEFPNTLWCMYSHEKRCKAFDPSHWKICFMHIYEQGAYLHSPFLFFTSWNDYSNLSQSKVLIFSISLCGEQTFSGPDVIKPFSCSSSIEHEIHPAHKC